MIRVIYTLSKSNLIAAKVNTAPITAKTPKQAPSAAPGLRWRPPTTTLRTVLPRIRSRSSDNSAVLASRVCLWDGQKEIRNKRGIQCPLLWAR
ncbi:hypothetical protein BHE90_004246 [Fusarium euwallaceae]|uniref:Uncharacterized protein n=2 Tax=Fusarium solani species complex TaxID=232080 RepID=A0A428T1L4_9HYPO|nr:hypothetical protein CEP52_011832 [Fusarium oligoseptatum]RTE81282.1 hypothetical protein BHE90_004246 [Fusarium euwallaceae]